MTFKHILKNNEVYSLHEALSIVRGGITQKKFHFYGEAASGTPDSEDKIKNYRGATYPVIDGEDRTPSNKITKNPMLKVPNVADMKYYGALPIFKTAMDQLLPKPVGVFSSPSNGAGASAGDLKNSNSSGENNLQNIVSNVLFGSSIGEDSHQFESLSNMTSNIGKMIGGDAKTIISTVTDDELIKLMQGLSTGLSNVSTFANGTDAYKDTSHSFDTNVFDEGLQIQKAVSEYIKSLLVQ